MGYWTYYRYDEVRRLRAVTNANGAVTLYDYCGCGSPSLIQQWDGTKWLTTLFDYDLAGRLKTALYPDGYQLEYTYDALDRILTVLDNGGHMVELEYNNYDQITGIKVGNPGSQRYWAIRQFDEYGRLIRSTDRNGVTTTNSYDFLDRVVNRRVIGAWEQEMSGLEVFEYNSRGLTNYTDPLGKVTRFVRDAMGRVLYQTNANLEVLSFTYNPAGQLLSLTDGKNQTTRWNYDAEGRVTNKVDALNAEMFRYRYDPNGRLTNRWQTGGITTTFRYDAVGNLTNVDYPNSPDIVLRYDPLNRLTNMVDGIGSTVFVWTDGSQLAAEDGPWPSDRVSYSYNRRQRAALTLQQPNASAWTQGYGYDEYWRLTNVTSPAGVFGYEYPDSRPSTLVTRLALPGGSFIENDYDDLGRLLWTVLCKANWTVLNSHAYQYNQGHQRTKQTFTAGNYVDYTYDNIGQLKTARGKEADGTARLHEQFGYAYDAAWNLNYRTNNSLVQTFNVNRLNQLTTISRSGTLTVAGAVSTTPTSVTVKDNANPAVAAAVYSDNTFARQNVPLIDGNNTFRAVAEDAYGRRDTNTVTVNLPATVTCYYDVRGNLTNDGRRVFFYDDENQLVCVLVSNAWKSEFAYDGLMRRRIRKEYTWSSAIANWQLTNEVRYVYDGRLVLEERAGNNLPLVTYTRGNDMSGSFQEAGGIGGLLARSEMSNLQSPHAYYHADGNGNMVNVFVYDAYGTLLASNGSPQTVYLYCGEQCDPHLGLYYLRARYLNPATGRFWTMDNFEGVQTDPLSLHKYLYAHVNPVGRIDPSGRESFISLMTATGIYMRLRSMYDTVVVSTGFALEKTIFGLQAGKSAEAILTEYVIETVTGAAVGVALGKVFGRAFDLGDEAAAVAAGANLFKEAVATRLPLGTKVFRVYVPGMSSKYGKFWTTVDPRKVKNYADAAGLPKKIADAVARGEVRVVGG